MANCINNYGLNLYIIYKSESLFPLVTASRLVKIFLNGKLVMNIPSLQQNSLPVDKSVLIHESLQFFTNRCAWKNRKMNFYEDHHYSGGILTISKHLLVQVFTPKVLHGAGSSCSCNSAAYPVGCLLPVLVIWLLKNTPQIHGVFGVDEGSDCAPFDDPRNGAETINLYETTDNIKLSSRKQYDNIIYVYTVPWTRLDQQFGRGDQTQKIIRHVFLYCKTTYHSEVEPSKTANDTIVAVAIIMILDELGPHVVRECACFRSCRSIYKRRANDEKTSSNMFIDNVRRAFHDYLVPDTTPKSTPHKLSYGLYFDFDFD
ncbi:hypothetical protein AGLY_004931 [Aphis glycines]|uniref:Uncharacterized protein n=1 Tax=Aphis glycines TaxID=307491 RepID=A0A6G0TXK9_APHGL|nr:hypothetical protein AGLY_004931 [Aphis glycines]